MVQIIDKEPPNRIVELFENKTILISGGSGFLGKVLIEKLLRSCSNVKKIYILLRPKYGKSVDERMKEIFGGPLFELVKKQRGKAIFDKVEAINGDITSLNLGISLEDRKKIIEEIEIIYHSAATVQFEEPFKKTVLLNVRGTKFMLELAKECKKLLVFCHVSTAYCHEDQDVLYEKTYPPPMCPHRVIDICEWLDEKTLDTIAKNIRGSSANNYTFTKALGESLATEQMDALPIIIQRPSAVIPIWKEPLPGWTDNINGPTGLLIGAGKGVIRTMYGQKNYVLDYVSVDVVANGLICTAWDYITYRTRRVYNITSSDEVKVTFQQIIDVGRHIVNTKCAFDYVLWYPGGSITNSRLLHNIKFVLYQLLPAILVDILLFMLGYKPFLVRAQKKINKGYKVFEYYSNREWEFKKENSQVLRNLLNETERKVFKVDSNGFDFSEYFSDCTLGARRYLRKEKDEDIPRALKKLKFMGYLDKFCKTMIIFGLVYLLYKKLVPLF